MQKTMRRLRNHFLGVAALATALTLSACSGGMSGMDMDETASPTDESSVTVASNAADVTFAQMMIPHHEQAVEMSDMLLAKDGVDQRIRDLATEIKAAQEPEIVQLRDWLAAWGADEGGRSGMDHGMDGMMSDDDMDALEKASGAEASRLFLEQMTVHHEGAIEMAQTELDDGQNEDAKAMAAAIVTTQTEEIGVMKDILASL